MPINARGYCRFEGQGPNENGSCACNAEYGHMPASCYYFVRKPDIQRTTAQQTRANVELVKARVTEFEEPLVLPDEYDPNCLCGSLIPECEACKSARYAWAAKRDAFQRTAYQDTVILLRHIKRLEAELADTVLEDAVCRGRGWQIDAPSAGGYLYNVLDCGGYCIGSGPTRRKAFSDAFRRTKDAYNA
jgi:hypothetical protein